MAIFRPFIRPSLAKRGFSFTISPGVNIFDVPGDANVVDTSDGNLVAGKMLKGQKGFSKGKEINGEIGTLTPDDFSPDDEAAYNDCRIVESAQNDNVGIFCYSVIGYIAGKIKIRIANLLSKNIRSGVRIGGIGGFIEGTYTGDATAVAGDIVSGKTAGAKGKMIEGSMPNNGGIGTITLAAGESKQIPYGFSEGGTVKAKTLAEQTDATAAANQIAAKQTAWVNGVKVTGSLVERGQAQYGTPALTASYLAINDLPEGMVW